MVTTKAKNVEAETPKKRNSARKSKPKKKPNGIDRAGTGKAPATKAGLTIPGTTTRGITALAEHLTEPGSRLAQVRGVDLVP